jgi:hypothetical protein
MAWLDTKRQLVCRGRTAKTYADLRRLVLVTHPLLRIQRPLRIYACLGKCLAVRPRQSRVIPTAYGVYGVGKGTYYYVNANKFM